MLRAVQQRHFDLTVCSGAPIAEPVPRRLVSANLENASRIRAFGSVRIFGHDGVPSVQFSSATNVQFTAAANIPIPNFKVLQFLSAGQSCRRHQLALVT